MILLSSQYAVSKPRVWGEGEGELTFVVLLKWRFHLVQRQRSGLVGHPERQLAGTSRDEKKPQFNKCAYFSSSNTCNNTSSMTTITSKKILVLRFLVLGISLASCLDSC
jgi:hypothetical protein